jgi:hypothetical protein
VQALRVATVRINFLTPQQVGWLTAAQIQSLEHDDFQFLHPGQIPTLTAAQAATVPDVGAFALWSEQSRAALTAPQVRALQTSTLRLDLLTAQQIGWLTAAQIRGLSFYEFEYLSAEQASYLTPAQIAAIPDVGAFTLWSADARAALTASQVQALNVAKVRINLLTPQQVGWLTTAQIQSLEHYDFPFLLRQPFRTWGPSRSGRPRRGPR